MLDVFGAQHEWQLIPAIGVFVQQRKRAAQMRIDRDNIVEKRSSVSRRRYGQQLQYSETSESATHRAMLRPVRDVRQ